jgi:CPA1 family monovalent cation:H+ antiporter
MIELSPLYLSLIVVIVLLIMLADKLKVAYPVLPVVTGLLISLLPGMPTLHI